MPKIFFLDTGLRNFALRNFTELSFRPDKGALFENAIFGELYKNLGVIDQLFFWRTISKTEVDFVLTGEQKWAFEAKFASDIRLRQPAGLRAFAKTYPDFKQVVVTIHAVINNCALYSSPLSTPRGSNALCAQLFMTVCIIIDSQPTRGSLTCPVG